MIDSPVPVILDIHATWCEPCKILYPILEQVAMRGGGQLRVAKLDADVERDLVAALRVEGLPTVFVVNKGKIVDSFVGIPDQVCVYDKHLLSNKHTRQP